jgi:hypothetical protein
MARYRNVEAIPKRPVKKILKTLPASAIPHSRHSSVQTHPPSKFPTDFHRSFEKYPSPFPLRSDILIVCADVLNRIGARTALPMKAVHPVSQRDMVTAPLDEGASRSHKSLWMFTVR